MEAEQKVNLKLLTYAEKSIPVNRYFYNYFAEDYNNRNRKSPIAALSNLSQIKKDIQKERDAVYDSMVYAENRIKELIDLVKGTDQAITYRKLCLEETILSLKRGGYKIYDSNKLIVGVDELKKAIDYLKKSVSNNSENELLNDDYNKLLENLFRKKEELVNINGQFIGLQDVISAVIRGVYPVKLNTYSTDKEYLEEQENKEKAYQRDVPQQPIDVWVLKLIKKALDKERGYKRYWHFEGRFEGTPNKNQIKERLIKEKVVGDLDDRTIIRRIKETIESYDISNLT